MSGYPLLSLAIWVPIVAGLVVLATGSDRNAPLARMLSLAGAVLGLLVTDTFRWKRDWAAWRIRFHLRGLRHRSGQRRARRMRGESSGRAW